MRRGGNWLSGFQHLSYSRRGESRSSTARFHVGNAKKSIEITGICWTEFYMCLICIVCCDQDCEADRTQWPITDTQLISTPRPSMRAVNGNAVPALWIHTPWYYRGRNFKWVSCNCVNTACTDNGGDEGWEWDLDCVRATGNTSS